MRMRTAVAVSRPSQAVSDRRHRVWSRPGTGKRRRRHPRRRETARASCGASRNPIGVARRGLTQGEEGIGGRAASPCSLSSLTPWNPCSSFPAPTAEQPCHAGCCDELEICTSNFRLVFLVSEVATSRSRLKRWVIALWVTVALLVAVGGGVVGYRTLLREKDRGVIACQSVETLSKVRASDDASNDISIEELKSLADGFKASQHADLREVGFLAVAYVARMQRDRKLGPKMADLWMLKVNQTVPALRSACVAHGADVD